MRRRSIAWICLLGLLPATAEAVRLRRIDPLVFSIHVDLLAQYDLEDLRRELEDARATLQGSEGPLDYPCCTRIDAVDLEVFGTPGDGLDVIDSQAKLDQLGSLNALVLDLSWPTPACGKVPAIGAEGMVVALDCPDIGNIVAHERGHNAGLFHREDESCEPLMRPLIGGGCLNISECGPLLSLGALDGTCTCLSPVQPDGAACSLDGEAGVCRAGGVCIEGEISVFPHQKISDTQGGFAGVLADGDAFGLAVASLGDFDGDGVGDLAVGAYLDDGAGLDRGAVWILLLEPDGTVKSQQKIGDGLGGFGGSLDDHDQFGIELTSPGDLDGDGIPDLAVGAWRDDDGGTNRGAVWILFLEADGTVRTQQKISDTQGGFTGALADVDLFGTGLAALGDLDGDGVPDLAVGSLADDGGADRGAVWILFLNLDGTVKSHQKISDTQGGFTGTLRDGDYFGSIVAAPGDLDGDGVIDLAVGARYDDDGGLNRGAVWILFLEADGTVRSHQKISDTQGGFSGGLSNDDQFRWVAALGDRNGDGMGDLAVGAARDNDGGWNRGAVWILYLESDGSVRSHEKLSSTAGGFLGKLDDDDRFGIVAALSDLDGDGWSDLAVGSPRDDDGGTDRGAVWVLFLPEPDGGLLLASGIAGLAALHRVRRRGPARRVG